MQPGQESKTASDLNQLTTIRLRIVTRERLKKFGSKGEDYDALLMRLMDSLDKK